MRLPGISRIYRSTSRFILCVVALLAGCALRLPTPATAPEPALLAAYVVVGENGTAWARAITPANAPGLPDSICPLITVDGATQPMQVRVPAATLAQRPTASDPAYSKPSMFPVLTCEFSLPAKASRATIGAIELAIPKAEPRRIVVLGDTGCRMKKSDNAWQGCLDREQWPFRAVADAAAAFAPDLVIHLGDYHYRENRCAPNVAGCLGSPWGYGWDTWQADLFEPAAKLLAAAPWAVTRGNHEECRRAGQGWFRFLDTRPFDEMRSCNEAKNDLTGNFTPPYAVPISRDQQLIMFDSAVSGGTPLDPARPRDAYAFKQYRQQFERVDELAGKAGVSSIFVNHHPILGYESNNLLGPREGSPALVSVMKSLHPFAYYPAGVTLALHGHVHLFEAISFSSNHPATILSGVGGDETYTNLPDPFPASVGPAEGVTLESITHSNQFGFLVMDKQEGTWQIRAYNHHGELQTTCVLAGSKLRCDKTGLLK